MEMTKWSGDKNQKRMLLLLFSGKRFCHGHKLIPLQINLGGKKRKYVHLHSTILVGCSSHMYFSLETKHSQFYKF